MRVVGALITFLTCLTYLLTFVFGGVVTMLLYAGSSRSQNRQRGPRAKAKQTSRFAERLVDSTDWKNPHEMFEPGKEVVSYRSPQECGDMIEYYLQHDEETWHASRA